MPSPGANFGSLYAHWGQEVGGLGERVVRPLDEQRLVLHAVLLVGVVADAGGVGEQVVRRHLGSHTGVLEAQVADDRAAQGERACPDLLEHRDRREQLRDRRGVEPVLGATRHAPRPAGQPVAALEHHLSGLLDADHAGELVLAGALLEVAVDGLDVHRISLPA